MVAEVAEWISSIGVATEGTRPSPCSAACSARSVPNLSNRLTWRALGEPDDAGAELVQRAGVREQLDRHGEVQPVLDLHDEIHGPHGVQADLLDEVGTAVDRPGAGLHHVERLAHRLLDRRGLYLHYGSHCSGRPFADPGCGTAFVSAGKL